MSPVRATRSGGSAAISPSSQRTDCGRPASADRCVSVSCITVRRRRRLAEVEPEHPTIVAAYPRLMATTLMVWIDQDLCTGDGICSEICPDVFVGRDDGLWVVKEEASHFGSTIVFDGVDGAGHGPDGARAWPASPTR